MTDFRLQNQLTANVFYFTLFPLFKVMAAELFSASMIYQNGSEWRAPLTKCKKHTDTLNVYRWLTFGHRNTHIITILGRLSAYWIVGKNNGRIEWKSCPPVPIALQWHTLCCRQNKKNLMVKLISWRKINHLDQLVNRLIHRKVAISGSPTLQGYSD